MDKPLITIIKDLIELITDKGLPEENGKFVLEINGEKKLYSEQEVEDFLGGLEFLELAHKLDKR